MAALPVDAQITFLPVADLGRSAAFYEGALGLALVVDQGTCRIYRVAGAAYLGVCERSGAAAAAGVIVTLVSPAVAAWHERLTAAGVEVVAPPSFSEQYHIHHAFYRDPDGHLIEVQEFADPAWAGPPARRPGRPVL
ncbi:MAG: VOC family protein [Actinobacteria bacterium]|nr:VOC family protein [Actinomycetota bacterium]